MHVPVEGNAWLQRCVGPLGVRAGNIRHPSYRSFILQHRGGKLRYLQSRGNTNERGVHVCMRVKMDARVRYLQ